MAFTPITVTRRYLTAELTPATGTVRMKPTAPMVNGDTVVAASRVGTLDAEGDLTLVVAANNDPGTTPTPVSYEVLEQIDGQQARSYYVVVPYDAAGGTVALSALNVAAAPPVVTYPAPGPQGPAGPNTIATATDFNGADAQVGGDVAVTQVSPLGFAARPPQVLDVESYRIPGDDLATLTAAFAAVNSGQTIRFGHGRTYTIASGLAVVMSGKTDVTVDFNGATIVAPAVAGAIFTISGEYWAAATTAAAAVAAGATTFTTAGAVALAAGDIITLRSSAEVFNPDRPTEYLKGEIARVAGVVGTTVTLESPTLYSYSVTGNTVTVGRITPVTRLTILHPSIIGAGSGDAGTAQLGVYVRYFDDCTIIRPHVVSAKRTGVAGMTGYNLKVTGGAVEDCDETGLGYGIRALSVDGVTFAYNKGRRNRHTLDVDSFAATSPFPCRNVFYFRNEAEDDSSAGISTHGGCDVATITHNITRNCGGGFVIRGRASTVTYNEVHGSKTHGESGESYQHAYLIGDDTPHPFGQGLAGVDLVFERNFADITNPRWATDGEASYGLYCTARLVRARIAHNRLRGFSSHAVYVKGEGTSDAELIGNDLDCSAQTGTGNGILLNPVTPPAGTVHALLRVGRNRIAAPGAEPVRIVGTVTSSTDDGAQLAGAWRPGWWYAPGGGQGSNVAIAAGNLFFVPIYIPHPVTLSHLGIEVITAAAASSVLLGIYSDADDGYGGIPGALLASTTVDSASTGFKSAASGITLPGGLHWLAACALGGGPTVRLCSTPGQAVGSPIGVGLAARAGFRVTGVSALPAQFTGTPDPQGGVPLPQVRVAD